MNIARPTATITRPADTTAYAAGDVVSDTPGTRFVFTIPEGYGGGRKLQSVIVSSSQAAATAPDLELWLFDTDVAAVADNAAFAPSDAEVLTCVGVVVLATANFKKGTLNAVCSTTNLQLPFAGNTLYGVLVVRNAYVPVSGEVFKVVLGVER